MRAPLHSFIDNLKSEVIAPTAKGLPQRAYGSTVADFLASAPTIDDFWTPLLTIDESALHHNIDLLAGWAHGRALDLMPHGKTTMAPTLWQRQLDAGAVGITLATLGQVRMARTAGVASIMLANEAVDPHGLAWLASELRDDGFTFSCWVDSIEGAKQMEAALGQAPRKVDVLIELGVPGKRTGVRSAQEGREVAEYVARSSYLRLAGVAGYEGVIGSDRLEPTLNAVRDFLRAQVDLHESFADLYDDGPLIVTAGGSAYFDIVGEVFQEVKTRAPRNTSWVIRSGSYITHDDGLYRELSPLSPAYLSADQALQPALAGYARVVSAPETGLVLGDGGRRDFAFDSGFPLLTGVSDSLGLPFRALAGEVTALNDQHTFVRVDEDVAVGSVLRFGVSHPCTNFDKWPYLPLVRDGEVIDLVRTFF